MNASLQKADEKSAAKEQERKSRIIEDELLGLGDIGAMSRQVIHKSVRAALAEIDELFRDKKWEDALALFYPVEEKMPELVGSPAADRVREKMAFALGRLKRFDEAITALEICLTAAPDNYFVHNSLAYTAYNSLYAAKNREIFLSGKPRKDRIDLAHRHFTAALALRPDSVTNCYREAMLFRQIEDKGTPALPLFLRAIANWENLSAEEKQARHQERKNYVKSLYQGASLLLENGNSGKAMEMIQRCLAEDKESNYLSPTFKYFAVGKIHFHRQQYEEAKQALVFSLKSRTTGPVDFVRELLARFLLARGRRYNDETLRVAAARIRSVRRVCSMEPVNLERLRGLEGMGTRIYFGTFGGLIKNQAFTFQGRNRRPPLDPVNALLSFVYTLLTNEVLSAVKASGMDPYLGALHEISYGRPSLACDLVEEYRCLLGDRMVLGLINRKMLTPDDFVYRENTPDNFIDEAEMKAKRPVEMKPAVMRTFIAAYEEMMARKIHYAADGRQTSYRFLIHRQAARFAADLSNDQNTYMPFTLDH